MDFIKDYIIQIILTGVVGIIFSWITVKGLKWKAALNVLIAAIQQFEIEEKKLNASGKGFLEPEHEKYLAMFVKSLKRKIYVASPCSVDRTIKKEKGKLLNKGFITKEGKSTMKSIAILIVAALCLISVPCIAEESPFIDTVNAETIINQFSIELNSGYMVDLSRADGRNTLTAIHTIALIEYDIFENSGFNIDAGYRDKNGFVLGVSVDLQLARYFKKINMPIIRNIDPQFGYLGGWNMNQAEEDKSVFHGPYVTILKGKF